MMHWLDLSPNAWVAITATVAAMSCALPGVWLVLRRQSMMGDALSHTVLPGIVIAFLASAAASRSGWISAESLHSWEHLLFLLGAILAGLLTAWLTETLQNMANVESSAALGVVFTGLFALGLFLVRFRVDGVHLDVNCVLFGQLVHAVLDTVTMWGVEVPRAVLVNGTMLIINGGLILLLYKELTLSAFDPGLAKTQGIPPRAMHYAQMAATAATVVAAFETVGSVLVIGLIVIPAAAATLLTVRLKRVFVYSLLIAALAAILGNWMSQVVPPVLFQAMGHPELRQASVSGMIAVAAGLLFLFAWIVSPQQGLLVGMIGRASLRIRIAAEDLLGVLYRREELVREGRLIATENREGGGVAGGGTSGGHLSGGAAPPSTASLAARLRLGPVVSRLALWHLTRRGLVSRGAAVEQGGVDLPAGASDGICLTDSGRQEAENLVRAHRLWESYLDRHFELASDQLHFSAHRAEHYLDDGMRERLADELDSPASDPHGRHIPSRPPSPPQD